MQANAHIFRTRFARDIVAEFMMPVAAANWHKSTHGATRRRTRPIAPRRPDFHRLPQKAIILCDGMPAMPSKRALMAFFARKGFWVFHPRYRGAWESSGKFLRQSPEQDILDVINALPRGFRDLSSKKTYRVKFKQLLLLGASFGGAAVILASRDPRVTKGVAFCPVVDWNKLGKQDRLDTKPQFLREAFGEAYRFSIKDWNKLKNGKFYSPVAATKTIDGSKLFIIQTKDDKSVRWQPVAKFAKTVGAELWLQNRGGHLSSSLAMRPRYWRSIKKFLQKFLNKS